MCVFPCESVCCLSLSFECVCVRVVGDLHILPSPPLVSNASSFNNTCIYIYIYVIYIFSIFMCVLVCVY